MSEINVPKDVRVLDAEAHTAAAVSIVRDPNDVSVLVVATHTFATMLSSLAVDKVTGSVTDWAVTGLLTSSTLPPVGVTGSVRPLVP